MEQKELNVSRGIEVPETESPVNRIVELLVFLGGMAGTLLAPPILFLSIQHRMHESERMWWFIFIMALSVLSGTILGFAEYDRRKSRKVAQFGRRLAEIYSSAIRQSAFNPRLESRISDGRP
jgi:hypothetical protein